MSGGWHAVSHSRGAHYSVRRAGAKRALRAGLPRADAWRLARAMAAKEAATAYLHDATGRVVVRRTYKVE